MFAFFSTILYLLEFYSLLIFARVIISWLFIMNIISRNVQFFAMIERFLYVVTEPVLGRIRRILPDLGAIDISPIVAYFGIYFLKMFIATSIMPMFIPSFY